MSKSQPMKFLSRIKNLPENNFSPSTTFNYEKEAIGARILIFSNFIHGVLVFFPAIISLIFYINSPWLLETSFQGISQIQEIQLANLLASLEIFKVVIIFLIGYYGIIKFQQNRDNGDYGYWLALGMNRMTFFNYTIAGFSINGLSSMIIFLVHVIIIENFYFSYLEVIILLLLTFSSMYLFTNLLFTTYEAIDNAEMAFLSIISVYLISLIFTQMGNPLNSILNAELYFNQSNWFVLFGIQIGLGIILHYLGWRLHREIDVELGG